MKNKELDPEIQKRLVRVNDFYSYDPVTHAIYTSQTYHDYCLKIGQKLEEK